MSEYQNNQEDIKGHRTETVGTLQLGYVETDEKRPASFLARQRMLKDMFSRLAGLIILTQHDLKDAGVYRGGMRD